MARFRETGTVELGLELSQLCRKLTELRFQASRNQLVNTMAIRECRKNIARLRTVLRERELAEQT
ncbi:MAG: 50S ribosomal protein L29 [Armatimonadetes bacterium CG_4_10_14_3_um_filter_66_18]|nr:50S ribosomal protein L29 [Armatimonadota bacterium]OIO95688.1 MAG: 50S ribosomal protein L29 [Armatimonadetes bacterium CG2_30_66_41]PIU94078.1 MAG: 50S ribosomal protein L29 [Armatimonadetes bacterium CG06_land_8_20_14_3_00_66_21]PIW13283.1 MAG: 50S ribosomal protein L29 [Armatimonadetes bacterium CG17_big_fil_post_rev_8_21_14_2_50_66_6]PIX43111.1 MAG: 50S ribosomal protein L29 [Armatimonadetes bacterium CG_4_8_14_3_um_filter_66_20]PIY36214.1 MAG: 50S ribosomal protein L29 [Armatimonadete